MRGVLHQALGQDPRDLEGVFFCEAAFNPISTNFSAFRIEAQVVLLDGEEFLWLDGLDFDDPVLMPAECLQDVRFMGSLDTLLVQYAPQIQMLAVTEDLTSVSPTVLLRAARCMVEDGLSSSEAMLSAMSLSQMLLELDELDRRFMAAAIQKTMAAVQMYG